MKWAAGFLVLVAIGTGSWLGYATGSPADDVPVEDLTADDVQAIIDASGPTPVPPPLDESPIIAAPSGEDQLRSIVARQPDAYKFGDGETVAVYTPPWEKYPAFVAVFDILSLNVATVTLQKQIVEADSLDPQARQRIESLVQSPAFDAFLKGVQK